MILLKILLFVFVGDVSFSSVNGLALTKEQCVNSIRTIDTLEGFLHFATRLIPNEGIVLEEEKIKLVNKCLHSINGLEDIKVLRRIVKQVATIHSVCEPDFTDQLLKFDKQMKDNVSRGKILKRKQKHRLSHYFTLLAGQVILTCKRSLAQKLQLAEDTNKELNGSLVKIIGISTKTRAPIDSYKTKNLSGVMRKLLVLATKYTPAVFDKVENLILVESLKPKSKTKFSIGVTLNSQKMLDEFETMKRACQVIDDYAQTSIYTISRLAWSGYLASNEADDLDKSLSTDERVQKWLRAIQYCQGILLVRASVDLEHKSCENVDDEEEKEVPNLDQILTVELTREDESNDQLKKVRGHKFEQPDTFRTFDANLKCYTQSRGLTEWLLRRQSSKAELMLARYVKLKVTDESIRQSLLEIGEDSEQEVRFGGGTTATVGHAGVNHLAQAGTTIAHHSHHMSSGAYLGMIYAISFSAIVIALIISVILLKRCNRYCVEHDVKLVPPEYQ